MNKPCYVHFHPDDAPLVADLPERYQERVVDSAGLEDAQHQIALTLAVGHAFYIDVAPHLLRTRANGDKLEDPVDFPVSTVSFIEWFYDKKG